MSSYFHCLAYDDAQAKIRVEDDAIYMELKDGNIDIHLTSLTVEVENKNIDADNFKIPIGCCDNELVYNYAESSW